MKEKSGLVGYQDKEIAFIAANFSYKECTVYVEDDSKKGSCRCGMPRDEHSPEALKREASKWSITHIATHKPTFIYGTHTMPTGHQIKFLRLADSDDPTKLLELMCNYWEMKNDAALTLVLSLIASPSGVIPEDVEEGLTHSVCVNSCWIISSGMAPMEKLEEVGRKRLNENHGKFHYCNICIEPWRQELLQLWQGHSSDSKEMTEFKAYTHCLFIDNGQQKEFSVSVTNEYRHRLEELIREEAGLPILRILIGGEPKDLVRVLTGLKSGFPLLICAGTDGLADLLVQALSYVTETPGFKDFTPSQQARLKVLLKNQDPRQDESTVNGAYKLLLNVVKYEQIISVFHSNADGPFDQKIFEAYAKSQNQRGLQALIRWAFIKDWPDLMDPLDCNIWMSFMCDVIQKHLCLCDFKENVDILQLCLKEGFGAAVADKRHVADCKISSTLLNSISVNLVPGMFITFLTQLTDTKAWSRQMAKEMEEVMVDLRNTEEHAKVAKSKASDALNEYYAFRANMRSKFGSDWLQVQVEKDKSPRELHQEAWKETEAAWQTAEKAQKEFEKVKSEMYKVCKHWLLLPAVWAVVLERYDIAALFWKRCKDPVSAGLSLSRVCDKLSQILPQYDTDNYVKLGDEGAKFQDFSVQLIERYYYQHPSRAVELLQLNPHYIPDQIKCSLFICSLPIQYVVEHGWWNGFSANPVVIMITFFLPFLVCTPLFSFAPVTVEEHSPALLALKAPEQAPEKKKKRQPTCCEKFRKFYNAPITKFYTHALFYFAFVVFYAYTVTVGIRPNYVSIFEFIVFIELVSFFSENVFEVIAMFRRSCHYNSCWQTVVDMPPFYKYDTFLNVFNIITVVLGLGRFVPFPAVKTLYVVSFVLHSFRFFKFYYFYSNLGPKLAMVGRMVVELLEFLTFLLVFLVTTGVAMEGLLYLQRTNFTMEVVREVFVIQFYRLYGENNRELAQGEKDGCTAPDGVDCPVSNPLAPWLLNLYLLIVVTLMMNLLIAIFSNVFDQFESESRQIWKRTRCRLLVEFREKTIFPMPFNLIERIIRLIIAACGACVRCCRREVTEHKIVQFTESTPLKGKDVDKQVKKLHEQLKLAAKRAELKRMEVYLHYIRNDCLPHFLKKLKADKTDETAELLDLVQSKIQVEIEDLVHTVSALQSEIAELKDDANVKADQVMKRLDDLTKLLTK